MGDLHFIRTVVSSVSELTLFISHDLAVVADIADQIVVIQEGRIVEAGEKLETLDGIDHIETL